MTDSRHQLAEQLQPLGRQLNREKIDPCQVAAGPSEAKLMVGTTNRSMAGMCGAWLRKSKIPLGYEHSAGDGASPNEFNGLGLNSLRNGTGNFRIRIRENFSRNREFLTRNAWISNFKHPQDHDQRAGVTALTRP